MTQTTIKRDGGALKSDLRALRDELRLKMHLAGMDLKTEYERLEPKVERALNDVADASEVAMKQLLKRFTEIREQLSKH